MPEQRQPFRLTGVRSVRPAGRSRFARHGIRPVFALALALAFAGTTPAARAEAAVPSWGDGQDGVRTRHGVVVHAPRVSADGCPDGTVGISLAADGNSVAVSFSEMVVSAAPGPGSRHAAVTCALRLPVTAPAGTRLLLAGVTFRGTSLGLEDEGNRARQHTRYVIEDAGRRQVLRRSGRLTPAGPAGDWQRTDEFTRLTLGGACGGTTSGVTLTTTLGVTAGRSEALVSLDAADAVSAADKVRAVLRFDTASCTTTGPYAP